ncbi:MAG: threonine--tRNA ligase, partial [Elusimicrobia bacterium]|nr:threonine--tRNA ligase [Elusimicrobiota bacterium]
MNVTRQEQGMVSSESHSPAPAADLNSPEGLAALRHSCTHVMAQAVQELFPGTKITIGPAIEEGFYYDFDSEHRFTDEDLPKIEKRMRQIAEGNHAFRGEVVSPDASKAYWQKRGEPYKVEILEGLEGQTVTHYTHDTFTDLCRGGHVENTRSIRHFRLLSVAGAYWRGDERNKMLQRIYGTAFPSKDQLDAHLKRLEEAKRRDHRKLGAELDLFSIHEEVGGGLISWHPKGAVLRFQIETYLRGLLDADGYQFVYTPHVASEKLYARSGHLENYADLMYGPMEIEGNPFRAKPMNCPNHIMIYKTRLHSYRELPLRLAEFGTVYRFEKSGVLHGLLRVRGFTQDDAHIFCRMDQIGPEITKLLRLAKRVYQDFGFPEIKSFLSTQPPKSAGVPELWAQAETMLKAALDSEGFRYEVDPGGGAFYGPKIDLKIKDAIGREWQLCTIQLDFTLPRKFDAKYRNDKSGEDFVVMIHRAILGSFERFLGVLIEHYAGHFPLWLAPVQVKVLTVATEVEA